MNGEPALSLSSAEQQAFAQRWATAPGTRNELVIEELEQNLSPENVPTMHVEADIPYLSVERVMHTALAKGIRQLRVTSAGHTYSVAIGEGALRRDEDGDALIVILVHDGISIKGPGGNVAPGCQALGPGLAIPRVTPFTDVATSAAKCVERVSRAAALNHFFLTASGTTPFGEVTQTLQAITSTGVVFVGFRAL